MLFFMKASLKSENKPMNAFFTTNIDKHYTCLCSHGKRRLAAASAVDCHDAECVLGIWGERLDFSRGGGHCVFSEKAIVILDSYDVMSGSSLRAESHHQGLAILRLHRLDGIHHLRG